jgi:hypothetical protein
MSNFSNSRWSPTSSTWFLAIATLILLVSEQGFSANELGEYGSVCQQFLLNVQRRGLDVKEFLNCPPSGCRPILVGAVEARDWATVEELLRWGADPLVRDAVGNNAFSVAEGIHEFTRLQELVARTQGDSARHLTQVRDDLRAIGLQERDIERVIGHPSSDWQNLEVDLRGRKSDVLEAAIQNGLPSLIQYLVEVKGKSLDRFAILKPTGRFQVGPTHEDEFNYKLWAIALLSHDNGKFYEFLVKQDFPVFERYPTMRGMSPLSMMLGAYIMIVPKGYQDAQPPAMDPNRVRHVLRAGADPALDASFMQHLYKKPDEFAQIWNILLNEDYPKKKETLQQLQISFAAFFHVDESNLNGARQTRDRLRDAGVNFEALDRSGTAKLNAAFYARTPEMARFLVKECGVNPTYKPASLGYDVAETLTNDFGSHIHGAPIIHKQFDKIEHLVKRVRKKERFSDIETELLDLIAPLDEEHKKYYVNLLKTIDYYNHDANADFERVR